MIVRCLSLLAFLLALAGAPPSKAKDADKNRLRNLLENKYGSSSRTRGQPAPKKSDEQIYIIEKDGKVRRIKPRNSGLPDGKSITSTTRRDHAGIAGNVLIQGAASKPSAQRNAAAPQHRAASPSEQDAIRLAQSQGHTVVRPDIIIIQLKSSATDEQISALERKYNLHIIDYAPSLGALVARLPPDTSRSLAPQGDSREEPSIRQLLEPPIIRQLRAEPIVNSAFVKSTIRAQFLPAPSSATAALGARVLKWHWYIDTTDDGNWGLKAMRLPAAWKIMARVRKHRGQTKTPPVAILDTGFGTHPQLTYGNIKGKLPPRPIPANCALSHGTHVAGIIAARSSDGKGIDGIVPRSRLDIVPISKNAMLEDLQEGLEQGQLHLSYFVDAIRDLGEYFVEFPVSDGERRVVNVSLAYNWEWVRRFKDIDPRTDSTIRSQIKNHATFLQFLVENVSDQVLFVAAAGNDSVDDNPPFEAELATPFAFAALHKTSFFTPSDNIIVVEAHDRAHKRAHFSNVGGHVAAPGTDVLSTLSSDRTPYGVCSGTSQAAPHVTALAAMLFELAPDKKPAEIISIIRNAAQNEPGAASAPRVDALAAVTALSSRFLRQLADLDGNGAVDRKDLEIFKDKLIVIENGRFGAAITEDLNGDGVVDISERCWPTIDLNGSGRASYEEGDKRMVAGKLRSDLEIIEAAWTDQTETFAAALRETRLVELIRVWRETSLIAAQPAGDALIPCR